MLRSRAALALFALAGGAAACHLFIGREPDPLPACTLPSKISDAPGKPECKTCLERECCDLVGECQGTEDCGEAFVKQFECIGEQLAQSNDSRPGIPSWIRTTCDDRPKQLPASKAAAACMAQRCSDECFPACPPGTPAAECTGRRRCKLGPALPPLAGTGCDERRLQDQCCEVINDCLEDRPCLNVIRCLEKAQCLYVIGLENPTNEPCARDARCFANADVPFPLIVALTRCIPPSGACPSDASAGGSRDGPGDASMDAADASAE